MYCFRLAMYKVRRKDCSYRRLHVQIRFCRTNVEPLKKTYHNSTNRQVSFPPFVDSFNSFYTLFILSK